MTQCVYEVKVSSSAGHPVLLAEESICHVCVFQDRQMVVLHDECQFKIVFTMNSNREYPCFASFQQKLPPKSLVYI